VDLSDGNVYEAVLKRALSNLHAASFSPFCFREHRKRLERILPKSFLSAVSFHEKKYVRNRELDIAILHSFAKERAEEGKRAGKVMLGIFPQTSKVALQLQESW